MRNFIGVLQGIFIIFVLAPSALAQSHDVNGRIEKAKQCGINKNHNCEAEILLKLIEENNNILDTKSGYLSLSGAMLEFSMIKAGEKWTPKKTKEMASRLIIALKAIAPNSPHGYATAYGLKYNSCIILNDKACLSDVVIEICPNLDNWSLPFGGHEKVKDFTDELIQSFKAACE